ncbi:ubiquinol-cytochrome c reductase iron-sulfur subunit [candidate division KSB1 bacterium]
MSDKNRREFLDLVLGGGFALLSGAIIYPVAQYMTPPEVSESETATILAGNINDIPPGSGKEFRFGSKPGLLVRNDTGEFTAFISICTHLDCIVQFSKEKNGIWCACHGGMFDFHGNNISGPPPKPLTSLKVDIQGDNIYVSKIE